MLGRYTTTKISNWLFWCCCAVAVAYTIMTLSVAPSFALTAFGDIAQFLLAALITTAAAIRIKPSHARIRSFWLLMATGAGLWCTSLAIWAYYELISGRDLTYPSIQDAVLFLHLIPMMAALATLPHQRRKMPAVIPYTLGMLCVWWMYLYAYMVVPWQFVNLDLDRYGSSFNTLYTLEDSAFIVVLAILAWKTAGEWRKLYCRLLLGSLGYMLAAHVVNAAITERRYYTGSFFDLPLVFSMVCICWAITSVRTEDRIEELPEDPHGNLGETWLTRMSFFALLSVPVLAAWSLEFGDVPDAVCEFRVMLSLVAIVAFGSLLFMVQRLLKDQLHQSLVQMNDSVSKLAAAREALEHQATHDSMTGAMNRSAIVDALDRELGRAERAETAVAVLLIDLDHFKDINDRFGHHAGDVAIVTASDRMQNCLRSHDIFGRYGGEEFLVVIPETGYPGAVEIAQRVRQHLSATPVTWQSNEITLTATIGVALSRPGDSSHQLLRRADLALYSGKAVSRDTIQLADKDECVA